MGKSPVVSVLCWPGYTFITVTGTGKEVIVCSIGGAGSDQRCAVFRPPRSTHHHLSWWMYEVWGPSQGGAITGLFSCQQGSEAWSNKKPIHALVDFLCSLIHSLRWTLLFAGTTCVLVKQSGRASSLSRVIWTHVGEKSCVSAYTLELLEFSVIGLKTLECFVKFHLLPQLLGSAHHGCRVSCAMATHYEAAMFESLCPPLFIALTQQHSLLSLIYSTPCPHLCIFSTGLNTDIQPQQKK